MRPAPLALLLLAACDDRARVHAHLARVERELRASTPPGLDESRRQHRALQLDRLHRYAEAGRYPRNEDRPGRSPVFIDRQGTHCAVGELLAESGHGGLVERISRERNFARVRELADEPELVAWLDENGLTL